MNINNIAEFTNYIHAGNKSVIKSFINGNMKTIKESEIYMKNEQGDIYYVVNSGGDKNDMITNFNAVFVDLDCGRDKNKNYYSLNIVQEYKNKKLDEIKGFNLSPTFVIETRNGLHVYWVLDSNTDNQTWKNCMLKLIQKFDGDKQVNNESRLMRLPFTKWMKETNNPFDINIIEYNDIRYSIYKVLDGLIDINIDKHTKVEKSVPQRTSYTNAYLLGTYNPSVYVQAIKNGDIELLQALIKPEPIMFENQGQFYNHITQVIHLGNFLGGLENKCKCIFHDDQNPSAGVFITKKDQYFYKCHSSKCGFMGNIIRCVERLRKCNRPQAINFIKQVYKLEIVESDWHKEQKQLLEENKRMLREGEFEESYPDIFKLIKKYIGLINELHDIAIDNIYDDRYSDDNNNVVFYSSLQNIADKLHLSSHRRVTDRVGLITFLSLLNKLTEKEIPEKYLNKAKHFAAKNKHQNLINFYSIPSYCDEVLAKSQDRATLYKDSHLSMSGWSRELLQRTFGDDVANEVYPQFTHRKISKKSDEITINIHNVVIGLLSEKEYVMENDIIEVLRSKFGKGQTHTQIKKSLQEMLDIYGLERTRANKIIKEQLGIAGNGYPFIIIKKR